MEIAIDHPYFTFSQAVPLWQIEKDGTTQWVDEQQVDNTIKDHQDATLLVSDPQYKQGSEAIPKYREQRSTDLCLSGGSLNDFCANQIRPNFNQESFLNAIFIKKINSLSSRDASTLIDIQLQLYRQRGEQKKGFVRYLELLFDQHPSTVIEAWIEKNKVTGRGDHSDKETTARQIALAFYYLSKTNIINVGLSNKQKAGRFLEFFSSIGAENIARRLAEINNGKFKNTKPGQSTEELIDDLEIVKNFFIDHHFWDASKMVSNSILSIRHDKNNSMTE